MTVEQTLNTEFNLLMKELIQKHIQLGMKASGNWINELEVETGPFSAKITGEEYTKQLVSGRKPGNRPPISAIKQWIKDKGIVSNIKSKDPITALAFAIATKIGQSGTKYFRQGGTELLDAVITPARVQQIVKSVGAVSSLEFVKKIENEFKKIKINR